MEITSSGVSANYSGSSAQAVKDIIQGPAQKEQQAEEKKVEIVVESKVNAISDESGHIDVLA